MFNINYLKMFPFDLTVMVLLNCIASYGEVLLLFSLTWLNIIGVDKVIEIPVSVLRNAVQQQHKLLSPKWPVRMNQHLFQQKLRPVVLIDMEFIARPLYPKNWTLRFQCRTTVYGFLLRASPRNIWFSVVWSCNRRVRRMCTALMFEQRNTKLSTAGSGKWW